MTIETCENCKYGFKRSNFSYKKYGNYAYGYECCLIENERTPYRKKTDGCEKWKEKNNESKRVN